MRLEMTDEAATEYQKEMDSEWDLVVLGLAKSKEFSCRDTAAEWGNIEALKLLWNDPEELVRRKVVNNAATPTDILILMCSDPVDFVSSAAKQAVKSRDILGDLLE